MRFNISVSCFLVCSWLVLCAQAQPFPRFDLIPGGVVRIPLRDIAHQPIVRYNAARVAVLENKHGTRWLAIVGVPLASKSGTHTAYVTHGATHYSVAFFIHNYEYQKQYITLKNRNYVTPDAATLARIKVDFKDAKKAYQKWYTPTPMPSLSFAFPLPMGIISGNFGNQRYFNNQPRKPHAGIDIAAPKGTPVYAVSDGRVSLAKALFFNGNAIFIDHGYGIISVYFHLDTTLVKSGQWVRRGQKIATVGSTGRSTGNHLHFGVSVNNARVNPELFYPEGAFVDYYSP